MSLRAVVEFIVHFERFRNVDLFRQGCYRIKARLATELTLVKAIPTACLELLSSTDGKEQGSYASQQLPPSAIIDDDQSVQTRSFLIRYIDEEVDIAEAGHFRLELETNENLEFESVILEVQLVFASIKGKERMEFAPEEFELVSTRQYRLSGVASDFHHFVPVIFDDMHLASVNTTVHAVLLDFCFRPKRSTKADNAPFASPAPSAARQSPARQSPLSFASLLYSNSMPIQIPSVIRDGAYVQQAIELHRTGLMALKSAYDGLSRSLCDILDVLVAAGERVDVDVPALRLPPRWNDAMGLGDAAGDAVSSSAATSAPTHTTSASAPISEALLAAARLSPPEDALRRASRSPTKRRLFGSAPMRTPATPLRDSDGAAAAIVSTGAFHVVAASPRAAAPGRVGMSTANRRRSISASQVLSTNVAEVIRATQSDEALSESDSRLSDLSDHSSEACGVLAPDEFVNDGQSGPVADAHERAEREHEAPARRGSVPFIVVETATPADPTGLPAVPRPAVDQAQQAEAAPGIDKGIVQPETRPKRAHTAPEGMTVIIPQGQTPSAAAIDVPAIAPRVLSMTSSVLTAPPSARPPRDPSLAGRAIQPDTVELHLNPIHRRRSVSGSTPASPASADKQQGSKLTRPLHEIELRLLPVALAEDFHVVAEQIFILWHMFLKWFERGSRKLCSLLRPEHETQYTKLWKRSVLTETFPITSRNQVVPDDQRMSDRAAALRKLWRTRSFVPLLVDDLGLNIAPELVPIIFEQRYTLQLRAPTTADTVRSMESVLAAQLTPPPLPQRPGSDAHVFVFVHGFQGNSYDLRLFKAFIAMLNPRAQLLASTVNEDGTLGNIADMGHALAQEVVQFVSDLSSSVARISFVAHSMGAVITRAALADSLMAPYLPKLFTFVSMSGPHCGTLYSHNRVVDSGMRFMKSWKNAFSLTQLMLEDGPTVDQCYLYKLSEKPGLELFTNVLLLSSAQDRYVPYHSARIEVSRDALSDSKRGKLYVKMVENLLRPLDGVNFARFDISFPPAVGKRLDSAIGRAAHISFLDNSTFARLFVNHYRQYFM
eukprot:TRINITY_DN7973_c0_g1_i1.p1 TRINITY_DN7973_c0_g1~~TRINITY_DN7973_c0_g1_i1.p1  ORF type:complete len:1080 (+),score=218.26 TRINITY_DN7973_c0_g1_i1:59-3241(+)